MVFVFSFYGSKAPSVFAVILIFIFFYDFILDRGDAIQTKHIESQAQSYSSKVQYIEEFLVLQEIDFSCSVTFLKLFYWNRKV